jgi:hypothetical protein
MEPFEVAHQAQRVKKAARVHVMPASAAANTRFRWRSTTNAEDDEQRHSQKE